MKPAAIRVGCIMDDDVVALAGEDTIRSCAAIYRVITIATVNQVGAAAAAYRIVTLFPRMMSALLLPMIIDMMPS